MAGSFGAVLRSHRIAASLTQEALAERAGISATAVASLERGRRRAPRLSTVRELAEALGLSEAERAVLAAAASAGDDDVGPDEIDAPAPAVVRPASVDATAPAGSLPLPPPMTARRRTAFVGRRAALERLAAGYEDRRRLITVGGEAGAGKTRVVAEFARIAHAQGATVAWAGCRPESLGAYSPFVDGFRHLVVHLDTASLAAGTSGRGDLARLVPELRDRIPALPPVTRAGGAAETGALFDACARLLAVCGPLVLVVDDLHWCDGASLALLAYLALDPRLTELVIVATARTAELDADTRGTLADLARRVETERIELNGLDRDELAQLAAGLIGRAAPASLLEMTARVTDGNAFFAEEIVVNFVDAGLDPAADPSAADLASIAVPAQVRDALAPRLAELSPDATAFVGAAAILGRDFDRLVAADVAGLEGDSAVDAADDALLSGVAVETSPRLMSFSHAIVRDAVALDLSAARRARLHRRAAEVLETRPETPDTIAEIARHWEAVHAVDPTVAVAAATWAVRAGDAASAAAANDDAIVRYERAAALWAASSYGHADTLVRLGTALDHQGRLAESVTRLWEAYHLGAALDATDVMARAVIVLSATIEYTSTDERLVAALETVLARLDPDDNVLRPRVIGGLALQLAFDENDAGIARRNELARAAYAAAVAPAADPDFLVALGAGGLFVGEVEPELLARVADRVLALAADRGDDVTRYKVAFARAWAALELGDTDGLRGAADAYEDAARRLQFPMQLSFAAALHATVASIQGDYARADALGAEAGTHIARANDPNAAILALAQPVLRSFDVDGAPEMYELMRAAAPALSANRTFASAFALCAALAGDHDASAALVADLAAPGIATRPHDVHWSPTLAFMASASVVTGNDRYASALYDALVTNWARAVRVGPVVGWWGPVDHHLGALCRLLGRSDEAEGRLRGALELEAAMHARPFEARTRIELARVLRLRGRRADTAEVGELIAAARTTARAIGAHAIAAEADADL